VIVECQTDLLEVVAAFCSRSRVSHFLDRREQQGDQYRDDGNDHEQFNQRKTVTTPNGCGHENPRFFASRVR
jgi:hypothetical protein